MYLAVDDKGQDYLIPAPPLPKDISVALVRKALEEFGAVRVLMVDEAWCASGGPETEELVRRHGSVEHTPGRTEVIYYHAEDETEGVLAASREIVRDERGAPSLGPLTFTPSGNASGRMVGMLPRRGSTH
jgi:hypothetical protein